MPGGPLFPVSAVPVTADLAFPYIYVSSNSNWKQEEMYGLKDTLSADATWRFAFHMPPTSVPTGTCKIRVLMRSNSATGNAKFHISCADVPVGNDPAGATLTSTGLQTITWAAAENHKYKELKVALPVTPVAGDIVVMDFVGETASWTLSTVFAFEISLIWE